MHWKTLVFCILETQRRRLVINFAVCFISVFSSYLVHLCMPLTTVGSVAHRAYMYMYGRPLTYRKPGAYMDLHLYIRLTEQDTTHRSFFFRVSAHILMYFINEPRCEKTGLRGFRPGPTQTGLYCHRRWLEA